MKVTVLGGSAAGGNTDQGCSGYLVETAGARLVLALGPGTLPELRRHADFRALAGVVVSHLHLDHVLDLLALRFALAYNPRPAPAPVPLWLPPGGHAFLATAARAFAAPGEADRFFSGVFAVNEYDPDRPLTLGTARLTFSPTAHFVPCWAIRVQERAGAKALAYTADTGPAADLVPLAAGADLLIAESTLLHPAADPGPNRGHLTAVEAADLARRAQVSTLVLTHLWEEHGFARYREQAAAIFPGRIEIATPGLAIDW